MTYEGFGLTIELPADWFGRIYTETAGPDAPTCSILQASTVSIPSFDDSVLTAARQLFGPSDACLMLFESPYRPILDEWYDAAALPVALSPADFSPMEGIPPNQSNFVRRVSLNNRYFMIWAIFASQPTVAQLSLINHVLSTLQVGAPVPVASLSS